MATLLERGSVIYLSAQTEVLYERLKGSKDRPLLQDLKSFNLLLEERKGVYEQANFMIDARKSMKNLLEICLSWINKDPS